MTPIIQVILSLKTQEASEVNFLVGRATRQVVLPCLLYLINARISDRARHMERFPKSLGFISIIHLGKSPLKTFARQNPSKKNMTADWTNLQTCVTFKAGQSVSFAAG